MTRKTPKSKASGKSKHAEKRERRRRRAKRLESLVIGRPRQTREDRHVMVALVMSSLIAGLLLIVNLDRSTNAAVAADSGFGTSLHGWPLVYLTRQFDSLPDYLMHTRRYDWPYPPVIGETRIWDMSSLLLDILICSAIVIVNYLVIRTIVFRYDQWKKTW